jgi:Sulfotransferase domain
MRQDSDMVTVSTNNGFRPVVLITLPKSGSMYLYHTLRLSYDLVTSQHFGGEFPHVELNRNLVSELLNSHKAISQTHIGPSHHNLAVLDHYFDLAVIHVRDPRQALLSWVHSIVNLMQNSAIDHKIFGFESGYFDLPLSARIDREIDRFYPAMIDWLTAWANVIDHQLDHSCNFIVTHFEDMAKDPPAAARHIADAFGLPKRELAYPD